MSEFNHIKEALARITVEIAKREFPQNWGTFLPELGSLQTKGVGSCCFRCIVNCTAMWLDSLRHEHFTVDKTEK